MFGQLMKQPQENQVKSLDSLCENLDNLRQPIAENLREKGKVPYYGASGIVDYVKNYLFDEVLLLVSEDGANLMSRKTPIAFSISGKSWVNNNANVLKFSSVSMQKYVETYLNLANLSVYINKNANPKLTQKKLKSILIPTPSKERLDDYYKIIESIDKLKFNEKI